MQPELMRTSQEDCVTSIIAQVRQMNEMTSEQAIYINSTISQSPLSNFLKQALVQAVVDRQNNKRYNAANWLEAQQKLLDPLNYFTRAQWTQLRDPAVSENTKIWMVGQ